MTSVDNELRSGLAGASSLHGGTVVAGMRITMALLVLLAVPLATNPARGGDFWGHLAERAAGRGDMDLKACRIYSGKVLYDCIAGAMDEMSSYLMISAPPGMQAALQTTASQLRTASNKGLQAPSNKAQALSAIAQCRSAFADLARATEGDKDSEAYGLNRVVGVLGRAAQLIQQRG